MPKLFKPRFSEGKSISLLSVFGGLAIATGLVFLLGVIAWSGSSGKSSNRTGLQNGSDTVSAQTATLGVNATQDPIFTVQNAGGSAVFTVNTPDSQVILGESNAVTGQLVFAGGGSGNTITIVGQPNATGDRTIVLPNESGTLCTTGSVCAGYAAASDAGNYVQIQGTTPTVQQVGGISVTGTVVARDFEGDGSAITGLDADNIESGTISDDRLSTNVALLNRTAQIFSGSNTFTGTFNSSGTMTSSGSTIISGSLTASGANNFTGSASFGNTVLVAYTDPLAFEIQKTDLTSVFAVDTTNGRVGIGNDSPDYDLDVNGDINATGSYNINGITICDGDGCITSSGSGYYIQNVGTTGDQQTGANFSIVSAGSSSVVATLQGSVGQTADLLQLKNGSGNTVFSVGASGDTTLSRTSATALLVQNASSVPVFKVNTSSPEVNVGGDLVPLANNTYNLGSASYYWHNVYTDTITANTISAAGSTISGTTSADFTINSDNPAGDLEDMNLIFFRGGSVANAVIGWDHTNDTFEINQPVQIQNTANSLNAFSVRDLLGNEYLNVNTQNGTTTLWGYEFGQSGSVLNLQNDDAVLSVANDSGFETSSINLYDSGSVSIGASDGNSTKILLDIDYVQGVKIAPDQSGGWVSPASLLTVSDINDEDLFQIGDTGATTFRNSTNSTSAFQIQDSAGTSNLFVADTTNTRVGIGASPANGKLTVGTNTTAQSGGIYFGTDTSLYRINSNELRTAGKFEAVGNLYAQAGGTQEVQIGNAGPSSKAAIVFGSNADVSLYRDAIDVLASDDSFRIANSQMIYFRNAGGSANLRTIDVDSSNNLNIARDDSIADIQLFGQILYYDDAASPTTVGSFNNGTYKGSALDTYSSGTLSVGTSVATAITLGSTSLTGTITIGQSTDSNIIAVGNADTATGKTQTINIGAGTGAGTGKSVVTVGSLANASSTTIQSGTGNLNLTTNSASASIIAKSQTNSATAFQIQNANSSAVLSVNTSSALITQSSIGLSYLGGADASGSTNSNTGSNSANSVYVQGRYAYITHGSSASTCSQTAGSAEGCELQVFDLTVPASPTYVGGADISGTANGGSGSGSSGYKISGSGKYVYVATTGSSTACSGSVGSAVGCELQVYDVTNPSAPAYVGGADVTGSTNTGSGDSAASLFVSGKYLYLGATSGDATACSQSAGSAIGCELKVFDISNPALPTYIGGADISGNANSGTGNNGINQLYVQGRYLYIAAQANSTTCSQSVGSAIGCELQVYDVSNPSSPAYVGGADTSGRTNAGTASQSLQDVYPSGGYLYAITNGNATTCSQSVGSAIGCDLQVYSISNPASPAYVGGADVSGSTNSGTGSTAPRQSGLRVSGKYVYISTNPSSSTCSQTAGSAEGCEYKMFNVSTPSAPTYVGGADVSGSTNSGTGSNTAVSIFVVGHYLYGATAGSATTCSQTAGSAIGCELQVYDIGGIDVTALSAGSFDAGSLQVQNNTDIFNQLSVGGNLTVGQSANIAGDLGVSGKVTFQNSANSTTAFQIQNSSGTSLLVVDTSGSILTIAGTTSTYVTLLLNEAHFKSTQTTKPTIGTPASCGDSPSAAVVNSSTDSAGSFTITAGATGSPSTCDTIVTFNKTYGAAPKSIIIAPTMAVGGTTDKREAYVSGSSATTFTIKLNNNLTGNTPANSEVFGFYYWVVE